MSDINVGKAFTEMLREQYMKKTYFNDWNFFIK